MSHGKNTVDTFIKERRDVEEADKTRTWSRGLSAAPVGSGAKSVFLVGPRGSGRMALGQALARQLKLPLAATERSADLPEADDEPAVRVVAPEVFRQSAGVLRARGVVAYLMASPGLLMERLGVTDEDERRRMAEESAMDEPVYLSNAHFVLPAGEDLAENLKSLAEKLALTGFGSGGASR